MNLANGRASMIFSTRDNPLRRPIGVTVFAIGGLAAASLVLALMALNWWQSASLKAEINGLRQQANGLRSQVEKADKIIAEGAEVANWLKMEVVWLEELAWLSRQFPKPEDAMLTNLSAASNGQRREMQLTGYARNVATVSELDGGLRDETHQVAGKTRNENRSESGYDIQFRSSVRISDQPSQPTPKAPGTGSKTTPPKETAAPGEDTEKQ